MSSTRRSRANSENLAAASVRHGHTVPEVFQRYTLPTQNNGRLEIRFLGVAALDLCSAAFYQVSETAPPRQQQQQQLEEDDTAESFVYLVSTDLPPKKRRRERVLRHDVIFCLNPPADASVPDPDLAYYIFPHDAVVEAVNEASPLEILFSFHTHAFAEDDSEPQKYMRRRSTDRGSLVFRRSSFDSSSRNVVSMRITGASRGLFLSIKQTVSGFETICRKMMQLMRRHSEQLADQRSLEIMHSNNQRQHAAAPPPPPEWDTQTTTSTVSVLDHTHHKNGHLLDTDEMVLDKEATNASNDIPDERSTLPSLASSAPAGLCGSNTGKSQVRTTTSNGGGGGSSTSSSSSIRKCLYCGSKSTPMWRRGPQGAGTLCNACGVKWKHGKILNGNNGGTVESPRERTIKTERRRKKASGSYNSQRASERRVSRSITHNQKSKMTTDDDMESAAQSLSLHEDNSEFTKHHQQQQQQQQQQSRDVIKPHSFSSSISGSYSPLESSPSSSPLLSAHDNLIEKFGLNDTSFPLSDAVEAATVLTLLKRS